MRNLWIPRLCLVTLLLVICQYATSQQISFSDATSLLSERQKGSPISKGFADVNGDYRDDLVRAANSDELMVDIQSNNGEFFQNIVIDTTEGSTWAIVVADIDNDGLPDIMSAGAYNSFKIYEATNDVNSYELRQTSDDDFFAQGANFVDINNDGWLDAFICDDDAESEVYLNDGTGNLVRSTNLIDMRTVPVSDNSGNYASEWVDVDGDRDLDLYIAKCRLGVEDAADPRRINMLFINELNEGGTFREAAGDWGVKIGQQSWTCNFGDIDNDGDQDLFISNHEFRSQLFENIDGERFEEIPIFGNSDELHFFAFQSSMADFNNDGFLDILLVGDGEQLLYNNGNSSFTSVAEPFGTTQPFSFALGDINDDGYVDAFASYRPLGPGETGNRDLLWQNSGSDNNYFALSLKGDQSNRSGAGAKVIIEGDWGQQCRVIQSGVGYGITNSLTARFGIGQSTAISRVIIEWPSGITDVFDGADLEINEHYLASEDQCIQQIAQANATGTRLDCTLSGTFLSVDEPFDEILWMPNGETTEEISVTEPGTYSAIVTRDGCQNFSQTIIVRGPEELNQPQPNIENDVVLCQGESINLSIRNDDPFEWSTGETSESINITESGTFFAVNSNNCDTISSDPINITFFDFNSPSDEFEDSYTQATAAQLQAPNETAVWYSDPAGTNVIATGQIFVTDVIDTDTTIYFDYDANVVPPGFIGGASVDNSVEAPDFSFDNVNGALFFAVQETCMFRSVRVNARVEGPRHIQIFDFITQTLIAETTVDIPAGVSEVPLDFLLEPGSYEMEVNAESSTATFGSNNPELGILTGAEIRYPFQISNLATISRSLFGREFYHYFFDWKMEPIVETCRSAITPYNLFFNTTAVTEALDFELEVFPNPLTDIVNIKSEKQILTISIIDYTGRTINKTNVNNSEVQLDLSTLENGNYIMELQGADFQTIKQLVKIK